MSTGFMENFTKKMYEIVVKKTKASSKCWDENVQIF